MLNFKKFRILNFKLYFNTLVIFFLSSLIFLLIERNICYRYIKYNGKYVDQVNTRKINRYNIFFLESNYHRQSLTTKELCSIESAAKVNPKAIIKVYTINAKLNNETKKLLKIYSNIRVIQFKPEIVFNNTPFLQWWLKGDVLKSPYSFAHIADAFR